MRNMYIFLIALYSVLGNYQLMSAKRGTLQIRKQSLIGQLISINTLGTVLGAYGLYYSGKKAIVMLDKYAKDTTEVTYPKLCWRIVESAWRLFWVKFSVVLLLESLDYDGLRNDILYTDQVHIIEINE